MLSLVGDVLWHNVLLSDFYFSRLADINGAATDTVGFPLFLVVFELISSAIVTYFVLAMSKKRPVLEGCWNGALLGLLMVGALNFVNHSLIAKWDSTVVMVDTAWGVLLGAICGLAIVLVAGKKG